MNVYRTTYQQFPIKIVLNAKVMKFTEAAALELLDMLNKVTKSQTKQEGEK